MKEIRTGRIFFDRVRRPGVCRVRQFYPFSRRAKEAEVEEMWLTHYSPSLTKPQYYMDEVRRIFPRAKAGNDGMTAELMFED